MENYPRMVAEALLDSGAFKISFDPLFTWASGVKSPIYCDLRALISDVQARDEIVEAFVTMMPNVKSADVIAGTATAGIPWAALLAKELGKPMIYVRGASKDHGTKKRIEGTLKPGQKVALIEDHISTGGSSISAVEALRGEGQADCDEIMAINTYEMPKADVNFKTAHVNLQTITNVSLILDLAKERGLIDDAKMQDLKRFLQDPGSWVPAA